MGSGYLWIKAFHIIFVTSWFAGLFYLPRIYVNLAMIDSHHPSAERTRLLGMARRLYKFTHPLMGLAIVFGVWMWLGYGVGLQGSGNGWMHAKLFLVLLIIGFQVMNGKLLKRFETNRNVHSHTWYRVYNEAPVLLLAIVVILVVVKPF
jgi:protoporphyrinogen IX oxidase